MDKYSERTKKFTGRTSNQHPIPPDRKVKILSEKAHILGILPLNLLASLRESEFQVIAQDAVGFSDGTVSLLLLMPDGVGHTYQNNPHWGAFGKDLDGKIRYGWWVYEDDCCETSCETSKTSHPASTNIAA